MQHKVIELDFKKIVMGLLKSFGFFFYNFSIFAYFIFHGWYLLYKDKRKFLLLITAILPFWAFALQFGVPDSYVFFLQPYIVMILISSYSYQYWIEKFYILKVLCFVQLILLPLFYFAVWKISLRIPQLQGLDTSKAYKGGLKYLLWPGMRDNIDFLQLSKDIYETRNKPESFEEFQWNYNQAVIFLKDNKAIK
jgi:hypothetical protein